jgi:nucleoside-diphosphate-sugar epimerase
MEVRRWIFVTGAGGFVGSNLAHMFAQRHGADVIAPSHETVDLTDRPLLHRCVAATRCGMATGSTGWPHRRSPRMPPSSSGLR